MSYYYVIYIFFSLSFIFVIPVYNASESKNIDKLKKLNGKINNGGVGNEKDFEIKVPEVFFEQICSKCSKKLIEYYEKGDLSTINLDDTPMHTENKEENHIKAFIKIIINLIDDDEKEEKDIDIKDNISIYLIHVLPMIIFFVIGLLSIFGWIICCICNLCNCCCCCCLIKKGAQIPFIIITYIFFGLIISFIIYGLINEKKFFIELSSVECSILKLIDQINYG